MTTKAAILWTVGIALGELVLGLLVLFLFVDIKAPNANQRAAALGQGFAMLSLFPLAAVWLMWAVRVRKERERKQRARAARY
jgi:hypothetical protein